MLKIELSDPSFVDLIIDVIHDNFFSVDQIHYDVENATLTVRFLKHVLISGGIIDRFVTRPKSSRVGLESYLRIHCVSGYKIEDTQRVGYYDFDVIKYDAQKHMLRLETGIPILIEIAVTQLKLSLEVTDNLVVEQ